MHVVIFEGSQWRHLIPFSLSRPVFLLTCGIGTLLDKQLRATQPTRLTLWVRPHLESYCRRYVLPTLPCPAQINVPLDDEPALLLSGRTLNLSGFDLPAEPCVVTDDFSDGPVIRQAYVQAPGLSHSDVMDRTDRWMSLHDLPHTMPQSRLPEYAWDLIGWNEEAIVADAFALDNSHHPPAPPVPGPYHLIDPDNIRVGKNVKLSHGCVIDASKGPVVLADDVIIGPNAVLQGPCSIGPQSQIAPLGSVRPGVSIGPMCKIGGEISNSIVIGHTNKSHDGFVGDSYIGEWVNLGAGTTTSNLKNTYGEVDMPVDGKWTPTGRRFLGSLIGDMSRTAIGTRLMTGTYIGQCCMVASSTPPPRMTPSFTFLTDDGPAPYQLDKAVQTMSAVFSRRHRPWTNEDDQALREIAAVAPAVELPPEE